MAYKVLYIHDNGKLGGAGNVLLHLLSGVDRQRFIPEVICGSEGPLVDRIRSLDVQVTVERLWRPEAIGKRAGFWVPRLRPLLSNFWELYSSVRRFRKHLTHRSYDLLHTNGLTSNLVGALASIGDSRPLIWHEHGIQPPGFRRIVYATFATIFPARNIFVSNVVRNAYGFFPGFRRKGVVVYNGLNVSHIDSSSVGKIDVHEELGIEDGSKLVVMASLLVPFKGQDLFIGAAHKLTPMYPDVHFLILGDIVTQMHKAYKKRLLKLVEDTDLTRQVHFLGLRQDVYSIFQQANIVVSASTVPEAFPTVILEAMHACKPVVATSIGGQLEIVNDHETGLLVEPNDPIKLAEAIGYMLSNPLKAEEMGRCGNQRVRDCFSLEQFVSGVQSVYQEVCDRC